MIEAAYPQRITIVGNGGTGKTTLGFYLAGLFSLPLHHMDMLIWQSNWRKTPDNEVESKLQKILDQPKWLIEGLGPLWTIEKRLQRAERILFLDYPLEQCKEWAMRRTAEFKDKQRPDAPEGCSFNGLDQVLLDLLETVDREFIPSIRAMVDDPVIAKKTICLCSPDEISHLVEQFTAV